jgi:hypothetical protein
MKNLEKTAPPASAPNESRRSFLGNLGKAAISTAAVAAVGTETLLAQKSIGDATEQVENLQPAAFALRSIACYQLRAGAAQAHLKASQLNLPRPDNKDELLYPTRIGNFSKGLPHQANGEVVPAAYNAFLGAIISRKHSDFEAIPMGGDRKLTNPQCGLAFDMEGVDAYSCVQSAPPAFASREIAAEIAENYWMALLRDVSFNDYQNNSIANQAAEDLTLFGADFKGPKAKGGQVTPNHLFRGLTAGDKAGPLMSQFWYLPCSFGANEVSQRIRTVRGVAEGGRDYMTDFNSWLTVQNGVTPPDAQVFDSTPRYMRNGRDLGEWVHIDVLFQGYFQAFLCLTGMNAPVDAGNPYRNSATQAAFGTFGGPHIATLLCEISTRALKAVWNQKWFVHRRMRPEAFGGRIHRALYDNANYPVHAEILNSISSSTRLGKYMPAGNALLPQAFPEGAPTHPAYGAGHATVAGACSTILKAWFDESTVIQNPVVPDATGTVLVPYSGSANLTVGGELNKIASNVANGRNMAGVHWRSDATESLKLGEAIAISVLRDQKGCYSEPFNGFTLTKFDGTTITV